LNAGLTFSCCKLQINDFSAIFTKTTMEQLIPVAAKLQDVLAAVSDNTRQMAADQDGGSGSGALLDLPQIVVIGGQSSGKSSVLESIVSRSFLPRGTGIVTRRPLILQLFNTSASGGSDSDHGNAAASTTSSRRGKTSKGSRRTDETDPNAAELQQSGSVGAGENDAELTSFEEWGEFLHKPGQKYYDFAAIRTEIIVETERVAVGQNISPQPIRLSIYSPHVLSLTLVDLPGMTKNPVGDQPDDIGQQIDHLCYQYAKNPQAIILAVTTAVQDLANSDALQLARRVDPEGKRTVGVLTKVDLMDGGTDCGDILRNKVIPLQLGYIAVVNRGQREVISDVSVRKGQKKELDFFKNHSVYGRDQQIMSRCGTTRLTLSLNHLLLRHIRHVSVLLLCSTSPFL
jgi:Dynamin family/Dynamin central region